MTRSPRLLGLSCPKGRSALEGKIERHWSIQMSRRRGSQVALYNFKKCFIKSIPQGEALRLIEGSDAVPMTASLSGEIPNWRDRNDYRLTALRLIKPKACSRTALAEADALICAGVTEDHHSKGYVEYVTAKVDVWPYIGDTKAPRVGSRVDNPQR